MKRPLLRALKYLAITLGVTVLLVAAFVAWLGISLSLDNRFKQEIQRVAAPDGTHDFVLLADIAGFGDPAWYVYELERGQHMSSVIREAHNTDGALFWNYSEDGRYTDAPRLEVRDRRYLVFSRGGRFHSLYDIPARRVLVNDESPWVSYAELPEGEKDRWVLRTLHSPIQRILAGGQATESRRVN